MFRRFRNNNHFSFFKFYILFHYLKFIRKYDSANEFDTFYNENVYKNFIKKTYRRTNKKINFETQILTYNIKLLNM